MRKNIKQLAPTLWIVIAAFVIAIFAVWGGGQQLGEGRAANIIASVGRTKIPLDSYYENLRQRLESMKKEFQGLDSKLIQQLGIPQQVLEQMIQQNLLLQAAKDLGLEASPDEIREKIMSFPAFQQDGKFIGLDQYKKILEWNRTSVADFERALREEIIMDKVIKVITAGIAVTEDEIWESYKNMNESTRLEYILVQEGKIELKEEPSSEELRKHFEENKEKYKMPERRQGEYIFFRTEDLKTEVKLADSDIDKYYRSNRSQFEEPEKIRVRRIYLPFRDKKKEIVKAEAENILERIKKGEDMTALAQLNSQDEKVLDGGDWGYVDWKKLSPQEKNEIERLSQGKTSPVLELEDGVSLLMVTEKNPPLIKPLEEVKDKITSILEEEKARELAEGRAKQLERDARKDKSLDVVAQKHGFKVKDTGLLANGDALGDIDPSGSFSRALFDLKEKEISPTLYTYKGVGVAQLLKIDPPRLAIFEEVQDKVKGDVLTIKKKEKALEKMKQVKNELSKTSMDKAAEMYNAEYKTAEEHKRGQYLSVISENKEIDALAFSLPLKEVSEPVEFEGGYIIIRVLDRKEVTKEDFEKNKKEEKGKLLERKRNSFLNSYVMKLWEEKRVKIKYNLFIKVNSDILSRFGGGEEK